MWKCRLSSSYSYSLCSKWPLFARTLAPSQICNCRAARSAMFCSKQREYELHVDKIEEIKQQLVKL